MTPNNVLPRMPVRGLTNRPPVTDCCQEENSEKELCFLGALGEVFLEENILNKQTERKGNSLCPIRRGVRNAMRRAAENLDRGQVGGRIPQKEHQGGGGGGEKKRKKNGGEIEAWERVGKKGRKGRKHGSAGHQSSH